MTRNPKVDWAMMEHEYVFSPDQPSFTDLAEKHVIARSAVADKARVGEWFKKRTEYLKRVDHSVIEALGQKWAQAGAALREKALLAAERTLDAYIKGVEDGVIKVDAKDAAMMTQVLNQQLSAIEAAARPDTMIVDGESEEMDPQFAAEAVAAARAALRRGRVAQIEAGEVDDGTSEPA